MNTLDPKNQQKSIPKCSPEQNYLSLFAMRYPVFQEATFYNLLVSYVNNRAFKQYQKLAKLLHYKTK